MVSPKIGLVGASQIRQEDGQALRPSKNGPRTLNPMRSIVSELYTEGRTRKLFEGLEAAQRHEDRLCEYLGAGLEPNHSNKCQPQTSKMAKQVFAVPELLEAILAWADLKSLVNMGQVSLEFRATIANSMPLQIKLGVKACEDKGPDEELFSSPFKHGYLGFKVTIEQKRNQTKGKITADLDVLGEKKRLSRIGSTWRRMFICQPPIKEMAGYLCYHEHRHARPSRWIASETGLTVGDLHDAARSILGLGPSCKECENKSSLDVSPFFDIERDWELGLQFGPCLSGVVFERIPDHYSSATATIRSCFNMLL